MYDDVVEAALEAETFDWPVKPYLDRDDNNQSLFVLVGTILILIVSFPMRLNVLLQKSLFHLDQMVYSHATFYI